jgi:hypothetical protein
LSCVERETRDKVSFDFIILKSGNFASLEQTHENAIRNKNKRRWHPHFLQGCESFKPETFEMEPSAEEVSALLPHFWHAMPPDEKNTVVAVVEQHENQFSVSCIKQINMECSIPMKEMQNIHLCLECHWEYPSQLDMEHPYLLTTQSVVAAEVREV